MSVQERPTHSRQSSHQKSKKPVEYTVIIRLPFARGDFVDPPPVEWDVVKDKALWKIISKGSDTRDLDWDDIAERFDVTLPFLMKQAAWLYERHFAGVRKQMQRLTTTKAAEVDSKSSSRISKVDEAKTTSGISRTPSTTTITQSRLFATRKPPQRQLGSPRQQDLKLSDSSKSEEESLAQSQAFRRPALTTKSTLGTLSSEGDAEDEDDGEDSYAGYLPFATIGAPKHDPSATLRGPELSRKGATVSSSTSSGTSAPPARDDTRPGPLSPKHKAQLRQLSPRSSRDVASDGTPSMGSSFSDLDDAGISASAIEDAVMSTMQAGGGSIASRVSGLSQAFRSQR